MINVTNNQRGFHRKLILQWIRIENVYIPLLIRVFNKQTNLAARYVQDGDIDIVNAVNVFTASLGHEVNKNYRKIATYYHKEILNQLGKGYIGSVEIKDSENIYWDFMDRWIATETARQVTMINRTTRKILQNLIANGLKNGLTNREIAKDIREKSKITSKFRAITIAKTETHSAYGKSVDETIKSTPSRIQLKRWLAVGDSRTRDAHIVADGEEVRADEKFINTGEALDYPGDTLGSGWNIINCRCVASYFVQK